MLLKSLGGGVGTGDSTIKKGFNGGKVVNKVVGRGASAHSNDAVRRVSPEDLISLLMGLKEFTSAWPSIEANINATP